MGRPQNIAILGAGLVGSLLSIILAKRGNSVAIYERRADMRKHDISGGKSINLALSNRGMWPIKRAGVIGQIEKMIIPMKGRMMHDENSLLTFQPYGIKGQSINSISRGGLNNVLIDEAENQGVTIFFNQPIVEVDHTKTTFTVNDDGTFREKQYDVIIGADGAFSVARAAFQQIDRFNYSQYYITHGYKELYIPPDSNGDFMLDKNALHIWPRSEYMLIALPNRDASFTVTLFLPFEGKISFSVLDTDEQVQDFFNSKFHDASVLMNDLTEVWNTNPTSSLVTVKCYPWVKNRTMLIGDAAHAVVPFYGQGMNCGFEDCRVFEDILNDTEDNWEVALNRYQESRKPNADAIADLAIENYTEMRDLVADENFLLRKQIESKLQSLFPGQWIPQYSMVTFNENISYSQAREVGIRQREIMDRVMDAPDIKSNWESLNFENIVNQLIQ